MKKSTKIILLMMFYQTLISMPKELNPQSPVIIRRMKNHVQKARHLRTCTRQIHLHPLLPVMIRQTLMPNC